MTDPTQASSLVAWQPVRKLEGGSDLLPLNFVNGQIDQIDRRGRENIEARDIILPTLRVLTGTSRPVQEGRPGAVVGRFYHSGVEKFYDPPLRVLLCAHTRSRALFPDERVEGHRGLEVCISRNGLRGNVYGLCEECQHKDWNGNVKPACFESHNFIALTPDGPAVLRFSKTSFKGGREFLTEWNLSPHPMWFHPCIVTTRLETKLVAGKQTPYYVLALRWERGETVPPAAQEVAWLIHQQVRAAHEAGTFSTDDEDRPPEE